MARWIVAIALAAAACSSEKQQTDGGGDDAPDPTDLNGGAVSGSRFKLTYYDLGPTRMLYAIRDTLRDEPCTPQSWRGGATYCTPTEASFVVFANAACTQPIGFDSTSTTCPEPPPPYFIDSDSVQCDHGIAHIYPRGAKLATTQYYRPDGTGGCAGPYTANSVDFYALGPEVPVADLGLLTPSAPSDTGRITQRFYTNPDGLRYPVRLLHDTQLDVACNANYDAFESTTGRCNPVNDSTESAYRDAACTVSQASTDSACPAPKVSVRYNQCPYEAPTYRAVAAAQTLTTVYSLTTATTCVASPADATQRYYDVGAEIAPAVTARVRGTGVDRIQPIVHTTPEGLRARDYYLYDSQLDGECTPRARADGSLVCAPFGFVTQPFFTDAACQMPIELMRIFKGAASCEAPAASPFSVSSVPVSACTTDFSVRRTGAAYTGAVYALAEGTCTVVDNSRHAVYRVLDIIPTNDLAPATLVTEP